MKFTPFLTSAAAFSLLAGPAYCKVYMTIEQAQAALFPGATLTPKFRTLTPEQVSEIEKSTGVKVRDHQVRMWKSSTGGWLIQDEVVGKHEFIPFALALDEKGAFKAIEILEYREAYGDQIHDKRWQAQFDGKTAGEQLKLGKQIKNISGATLSCRHITDGVARLLATYSTVSKAG